jgi:hypothetical protein
MSVGDIVAEQGWRWLFEFVNFKLEPQLRETVDADERRRLAELVVSTFRQIEATLKLSVDRRDYSTLAGIDTRWDDAIEDPWWLWEGSHAVEDELTTNIARWRAVSRLGIAMWAAHEAARDNDQPSRETAILMLRHIGGHFAVLDRLFLTYQWAYEDEHSRQEMHPWTDWYLSQLPEGRAYSIPTTEELMLAVLLLAAERIREGDVVRPRRWMEEQWDQIKTTLEQIESQEGRWAPLLSASVPVSAGLVPNEPSASQSLEDQVSLLRTVLAVGREKADEARQDEIRRAPPDPAKERELRERILKGFDQQRVLGYLAREARLTKQLGERPAGYERNVLRAWLPKQLLITGGRMVGIDMVAGDLVRASLRAEVQELLKALPSRSDVAVTNEPSVDVREAVRALGISTPTAAAILIPIPLVWETKRRLELDPIPEDVMDWLGEPRARRIEGTVGGIPVIDTPLLSDRVWIVDLARAVTWEEWPSDENSGLELSLQYFDRETAMQFLREHPETKDPEQSDEDWERIVRAQVLLQSFNCFRVVQADPEGATELVLAPELLT